MTNITIEVLRTIGYSEEEIKKIQAFELTQALIENECGLRRSVEQGEQE